MGGDVPKNSRLPRAVSRPYLGPFPARLFIYLRCNCALYGARYKLLARLFRALHSTDSKQMGITFFSLPF